MKFFGKTSLLSVLALATVLTASADPAHALGEKERNILAAIGGVAVVGAIARSATKGQAQPNYTHAPVMRGEMGWKLDQLNLSFNEMSRSDRLRAQRNMRAMGIYNGAIDGSWGRGTERAFTILLTDSDSNYDSVRNRQGADRFVREVVWVR